MEAKRRLWQGRSYRRTVELEEETLIAIPDGKSEGVVRSLQCRDRGKVQDLAIEVELEHEFLGDVSLQLLSPLGQAFLLQDRRLGRQTRLQQRYTLGNTPVLLGAIGVEVSGKWQLKVIDHAPGHTGQLKRWKLVMALQ
jgi:subtilisin-like proprotein convertase family protein